MFTWTSDSYNIPLSVSDWHKLFRAQTSWQNFSTLIQARLCPVKVKSHILKGFPPIFCLCLSMSLSLCVPLFLSLCVSLSLSVCLFLSLSLSLSPHHFLNFHQINIFDAPGFRTNAISTWNATRENCLDFRHKHFRPETQAYSDNQE